MIRWPHIILLVLAALFLSFSAVKNKAKAGVFTTESLRLHATAQTFQDTIINKQSKKQREEDEKNKIKEIAKAKKQYKPEKVEEDEDQENKKRRRQRPAGMERPPEIIRRNGG